MAYTRTYLSLFVGPVTDQPSGENWIPEGSLWLDPAPATGTWYRYRPADEESSPPVAAGWVELNIADA